MRALGSETRRSLGPPSAQRGGTSVEADPLATLRAAEEQVEEIAVMLRDAAHTPARSPARRSMGVKKFGVGEALTDDRRNVES